MSLTAHCEILWKWEPEVRRECDYSNLVRFHTRSIPCTEELCEPDAAQRAAPRHPGAGNGCHGRGKLSVCIGSACALLLSSSLTLRPRSREFSPSGRADCNGRFPNQGLSETATVALVSGFAPVHTRRGMLAGLSLHCTISIYAYPSGNMQRRHSSPFPVTHRHAFDKSWRLTTREHSVDLEIQFVEVSRAKCMWKLAHAGLTCVLQRPDDLQRSRRKIRGAVRRFDYSGGRSSCKGRGGSANECW